MLSHGTQYYFVFYVVDLQMLLGNLGLSVGTLRIIRPPPSTSSLNAQGLDKYLYALFVGFSNADNMAAPQQLRGNEISQRVPWVRLLLFKHHFTSSSIGILYIHRPFLC